VRRFPLLLMSALLLANASMCTAQILHKKKKVDQSTSTTNTVEPDKILYDKATDDIKHGKHEVGRLGLQTLINTYPDSEYLAKAKLAIADSYYKEGGSSNITQAIAGYKDFIVFFPFLPEAAYAQMQVAMCNYNEMPKSDRDTTHTHAAEEEFQTFLAKYPKDPLAPQAQQRLREVQEVLAQGQFLIANYYYVKGDKRAAAGRLLPLVARYPLYSKTDTALWMLGDVFEKSERKDIATGYYSQIVRNYPLSKYDADAKAKLVAFGVPVPQADPKALAWMTAEQNAPRPKETLLHRSKDVLHNGPDVHMSAQNGMPQMELESDTPPGTDVLTTGNRAATSGKSSIVTSVGVGDPKPQGAAEDVATSDSQTPAATNVPPEPGATVPADRTKAPATGTPADGSTAAAATTTTTEPGTTTENTSPTTPADSTKTDTPAAATDSSTPAATDGTQPAANQKESSSKKKGIKKLIPW
jgi:outer membrane protein assembly factor BamD